MSITLIMIVLTVGISWYAFQNPVLTSRWTFHPNTVYRNNEWHRFITSGFLHADWTHLFFNMLALYFFGRNVEYVFNNVFDPTSGAILFLLVYLGGIIVSDIPTYFKQRYNPGYHALGASGGVASIIFSSILFDPTSEIYLYFVFGLPGFVLGVLYLLYSYYQAQRMSDNINHDAHFYGAVYGFLVSLILVPSAGPLFIEQIGMWEGFSFMQ